MTPKRQGFGLICCSGLGAAGEIDGMTWEMVAGAMVGELPTVSNGLAWPLSAKELDTLIHSSSSSHQAIDPLAEVSIPFPS